MYDFPANSGRVNLWAIACKTVKSIKQKGENELFLYCLAGKQCIGRHVTLALCLGTSLTMVCIHSGSIPAAQSACQLPVRQGGDRASRSQVPHRSHQQNRSGNTRLAGECPIRPGRCSRQKGKPAELHGKTIITATKR